MGCRNASSTLRSGTSGLVRSNFLRNRIISRRSTTITPPAEPYSKFIGPRDRKRVGKWLLCVAGASFGTVVIGGITRITRSGLSMVDWHPFREFPPFTRARWEAEFEKYKQFPEFKLENHDMTLEQFKKIWWVEYLHRTMGRVTGLTFAIPFGYFVLTRTFPFQLMKKLYCIGGLLLCQGYLGWYMVKSGLEEETAKKYSHPHVSHYRLAAHLGTAFVFYSLVLSTAFELLLPPQMVSITPKHLLFRKCLIGLTGLVFVTAISGAFVAGLEAGLVYNSWPKMADRWIPTDINTKYPWYKNVTENPTTAQFDHRLLAHTVVLSVLALWLYSRRLNLPPRSRLAMNIFLGAAAAQTTLGIVTLLTYVPKPLASLHQAGALGLLSSAIWATHESKLFRLIPK